MHNSYGHFAATRLSRNRRNQGLKRGPQFMVMMQEPACAVSGAGCCARTLVPTRCLLCGHKPCQQLPV
jgi:hypothetical protein